MAHDSGIDAFVLNIGSDSWQPARVSDAYSAALALGLPFKLCMSFDMTVLPSGASALIGYVHEYAKHPNQLLRDGKPFVTTFAGETAFGGPDGWKTQVLQPLSDSGTPVFFSPAAFISPEEATGAWGGVLDGLVTWNSGWPLSLTSAALGIAGQTGALVTDVLGKVRTAIGSLDPDTPFINAFKGTGKAYIASVSPFFFTHYSPQSFNKNVSSFSQHPVIC